MRHCLICMLPLALAAGCASTESRMREHAGLFATLPEHAQKRLLDGRIAIGDSREMVYIAMGGPARANSHKDKSGVIIEQWIYTATTYGTYEIPPITLPGIEDEGLPTVMETSDNFDETRITFENGVVTAIDRLNQ